MRKNGVFLILLLMATVPFVTATELPFCTTYLRGDSNGDHVVNVADPIYLLNWLFKGGNSPACLEFGDVNGDLKVDLSDAIYLLRYLFLGGSAPSPDLEKQDAPPQLGFLHIFSDEEFVRAGNTIPDLNILPDQSLEFIDQSGEADITECQISSWPVDDQLKPLGEMKIIQKTDWAAQGFTGNRLSDIPFTILLKKKDFISGRYIVKAECSDRSGQVGSSEIIVKVENTLLSQKKDEERKFIPIKNQIDGKLIPLQAPPDPIPPQSKVPTGCCSVTCSIGGDVCQETTAVDCDSLSEQWNDKYPPYQSPDHLCKSIFGDESQATSINPDEKKTCDTEKSLQCYGDCKVEKMTILYRPEDSAPAELPIPLAFNYRFQTYPRDSTKLGPNEGINLFTRISFDSANPNNPYTNYIPLWRNGWSFIIYAKLTKGSDPEACKESQFAQIRIIGDLKYGGDVTRNVQGYMFTEEQLLKKRRLKDLKLAQIEEVEANLVWPKPLGANPTGCEIGSTIWCDDGYLHPYNPAKIHAPGESPVIAWWDNPGSFRRFSEFEDSGYDGESDITFGPGIVHTAMGSFSFPSGPHKSFSYEFQANFLSIIEDSGGGHRYVCKLENLIMKNNPKDITVNRKFTYQTPDCSCREQNWDWGEKNWNDIPGKEKLECGWNGITA